MVTQLQKFINTLKPGPLADILASTVDFGYEDRLKILDAVDLKMRVEETAELLIKQIQVLRISQKVHSTVKGNLSKKQRDYYLRQQMSAIKKELNEHNEDDNDDEDDNDLGELTKRLKNANLPEGVQKVAQRELRRLKRMQPAMGEYQVIQTYLEWLSEIPWAISNEDIIDLKKTRQQLDHDHFGVEKVKKRIIEYLAVRKLKKDLRGPILCLIGPPGVGKTSLGQSVASALGRKFHRISLGGVSNEAEIRGHRRTYLGSMPGLIAHALRKCGVNNPVILLDEIDKLGSSTIHGDPASALLEVLDPEQNHTFTDHYLNVPIDLSKVLFIATANQNETIPAPLLDRMEVIQIPGYTIDEKLVIARNHLMPKQLKIHGLTNEQLEIPERSLTKIIGEYTREAGVRNLEREIAAVCRVKAVQYAEAEEKKELPIYSKEITEQCVVDILGVEKVESEVAGRTSIPGVVTGLAWTASGSGDILFIEASQSPGKGRLHLTGKLGDVIKESAQLGLSWVKAHAFELGITPDTKSELVSQIDVHLHVPAGAVPKDGPSAGVAMVTSLVSMFTQRAIPPNLAMTGEITLRGQVLPVGGIKEKVLAAHRAGIKKVILPWRNRKDLKEIPENVQNDLEIILVKEIRDVLKATGLMEDLMMGLISRL
ncbi:ATP-dependent protease La [Basidiobolus meristosporus CBS 931.73]|uniref:ATP-dependent protease La n=1 Tax=Basidiobolus meristosporus CBS 931.73 TaxID=1314790 RepID=A0A1Y1ZCT4_9FUNG|nr:ATP-dependent protease La [Basidiobolus meristosporus CBS 931.73]|eukprot:ORY07974.1 ATP-dependent protease La [Basidiobolus meristosporus CBS 931.73]